MLRNLRQNKKAPIAPIANALSHQFRRIKALTPADLSLSPRRRPLLSRILRKLCAHPSANLLSHAAGLFGFHGILNHDIFVVVIVVVQQLWHVARCSWGVPAEVHLVCELCVGACGVHFVAFCESDVLLGEL
jgi:hypothetical protein